jgi:phosphatidylinositol glycan class A protein
MPLYDVHKMADSFVSLSRTMQLGPFAGPIWTIILIVDCIFFLFLEWWMPREDLDYVNAQWDPKAFASVRHQPPVFIFMD